jgi:integrase
MATIRKRGDKYQVQVRRRGVCSATKSFHTFQDAKAWARHMEVQADRHDLPPDTKVLQQITVGELVRRYRDTVTPHKRGQFFERAVLKNFLLHPICRRKLSHPLVPHFAAYRDERLTEVKPATLKRQLGPIHHMFEIARDEWGLPIRENPVGKLKFTGADQRRERRLRPGELDKLMHAAQACRNALMLPAIGLAVETAMRRGELLVIKTDHIDLGHKSLTVEETKNGQPRIIPLTERAIALLQDCMREQVKTENGFIFPITANAFRLNWERIKKKTGIDELHFHDLRHEAISRFFEMGLTVPEVAMISGHKDMRMLLRYTHAIREAVLEKLAKVQK